MVYWSQTEPKGDCTAAMNKQETYDYLTREGLSYEITEHKAVYNMAELAEVSLPWPDRDAKNLFVRDDKHQTYYLITVRGDKRVNLKEFRKQYGTRPLTFASPEELMDKMGLIPGAVTPLGLLADSTHRIEFYFDQDFLEAPGIIGVHPNDNTATVWLRAEELLSLIRRLGNPVHTVRF